jgi:hypothetical protein
MVNSVEVLLMGIFATLFMDISAKILTTLKIVHPPLESHIPGRWAIYILKGKFVHKDIHQTPALKNERTAALISHYLIGIILIGIYLLLESKIPSMQNQIWMTLLFGVTTVLLPWLWLYPSIGMGFLALKTKNQSEYIIFSIINHLNFGIGMTIWILFFRQFLT